MIGKWHFRKSGVRAAVAGALMALTAACGPLANNDPRANLTDTPNHRTGFCLGDFCSTANGDTRIDGHLESMLSGRNEILETPQDPALNVALAQSLTDITFLRKNASGEPELLGSKSVRVEIQTGGQSLIFERPLTLSGDGALYQFAMTKAQDNDRFQLVGYFADVYMGPPGQETNVKTFGTFHLFEFQDGTFRAYSTIDMKAYVGRIQVRTQVESTLRESKLASEIQRAEQSLAWVLDITVDGGRSFYHYDFIDMPSVANTLTPEQQLVSQLSFWGDSLDTSELEGETLPTRREPFRLTGLPQASAPLSERFLNVRGWGEGPAGPAGSRIMMADIMTEDGRLEEVAIRIDEAAPLTADQQQRIVRPEQFRAPVQEAVQNLEAQIDPGSGVQPDDSQPQRQYVAFPPPAAPPAPGEDGDTVLVVTEEPTTVHRTVALPPAAPVPAAPGGEETQFETRRPGYYVSGSQLKPAFELAAEPPVTTEQPAAAPAAPADSPPAPRPEPQRETRRVVALPRLDRQVITGIVARVQEGLRVTNDSLSPRAGDPDTPVEAASQDPHRLPDRVRYSYVQHSDDPSQSFLTVNLGDPRVRDAMLKFDRYYEKPYIQQTIREILSGRNSRGHRTYYDTMMTDSLRYGNPFRGMIETAFEGWSTPSIFGYRSLWESRFFRDADYPNNETNPNSTARGLGQFLTDTAGGSTVRMRVGGGVNDERRFVAPSLCGMAKYFNYFMDYFPHDPTLGFLAYHSGEGSRRSTNHAGVQGYARAALGGLDAVRARNYAFTYHELVEANVIPNHKEEWANNSIATTFILQNPAATYELSGGGSVSLRQPDRRLQIEDVVDRMRIRNSEGRVINHKVFHPTLEIHDPLCEQIMTPWKQQFPMDPENSPMS